MTEDGTPLPSFGSEMASKKKKSRRSMFKLEMKMHCYSLKNQDDALFNNSLKNLPFY